ncbi:methyltransferase [Pseudogulbenkiania subflava]|uniref:Thiopurine S-methyltransferase (TPMT) n=1 Tax=Pseudogulbenkiania subflava DSM 22618 TaxID=1123014 RepID=A0A1Y6C8B5_9NEIS|nr:methyltransferase [Pseudogulbenkiania subflava]SMF41754.1 Thiopurine S-methyltransferase (TPMT) [Pseudogulbenkiania subflava DSM 22618]
MKQNCAEPSFWDVRYASGVTPWDTADIPAAFQVFAETRPEGSRVLVPGCGSAHEVKLLLDHGFEVDAIDFSAEAVARARASLGASTDCVQQADFFLLPERQDYDWIYERAFFCALPLASREAYARKMATLLRPGGVLAGFFFLGDNLKGPPFGSTLQELQQWLLPWFDLLDMSRVGQTLPVFADREHWLAWQRR